ncbi:allophycocyanin subunit beta [Synechococcus sp. CS-602]|uniref:allophycocyanin subunit beta n=1 Tax=Synechococcaceae TaxID=1890426 RepID=UPI0008FF510A|nr:MULTISPECIES: allophycocyanin subunit beta [Synechococcaceae]MCT4364024.1 allophycocyanin subunit beta [Candidatus Regnicoccus frigidus MAG-AL1]APD47113.1 allophycocyanin subunit beta [Synechococcus sp. SynAce01]MCT0204888.1 allophycocyanin subunit beta [Synechococcus sp. CS-602]MCT0245844.1 allophycocyanin subunit beta [Synechococcus sp. CS-601]MCT4368727.1 allophycocyanin subunit beta [Candidatus Regnicoccus frigidus MAG-AL2]
MQDTITAAINPADEKGSYLASAELEALKQYFQSGSLRVKAASQIGASASSIISETVAKSLLYGDITCPGGNMYPTRRYAACLRDLTYFLRYATYAMLAADASILDERVLNGLRETYTSLGVPIEATLQAVKAMKEVVTQRVGADAGQQMDVYLDHIISGLS